MVLDASYALAGATGELTPNEADLNLDSVDEETRLAAERSRSEDEKALAKYRVCREANEANVAVAREALDGAMESRLQKGIERADDLIRELEGKLAAAGEFRLDPYGYHPTERAIRNAEHKAQARAEFQRAKQRRAVAPKCGWRKYEEQQSLIKGVFDGRTIVFDGSESAADRLERLFSVAMELNHPGIDPAGIESMKGYVKSGRFTNEHCE
jgi:hypothetical protein